MTTIVVSGPIANKLFNGGNAWAHMSYVLGFRKLGFDVYFVEELHPSACVALDGHPAAISDSVNRAYFRHIAEEFGLQGKMALISPQQQTLEGVDFTELVEILESADLLINISGHLDVEQLAKRVRRKAFLDLDPGFTQFWLAQSNYGFRIPPHDYYFTVGENIGAADCPIPTSGIRWRPTRQPVLLDQWPVTTEGDPHRFTTIATWRGPFGPVSYRGQTFGSKVHEFRKYVGIPRTTDATFEIALNIHPADYKDREALLKNSWHLEDPTKVVPDMSSFRRYVQTSGAEFSVAQEMYVGTHCGWFSDRTVRYLASGKPVLVEDTGFTRNYPAGNGLLTFTTPEEAVTGVRQITEKYSENATAARQIAEEYFDSNRVLNELLSQVF